MSEPYVAFFCPHCGTHVNENELDTDEDALKPEPPNYGSLYTCGWCHEQTRDYNHVKRCRSEHENLKRLRHIQRGQDLERLLGEISDLSPGITGVSPLPDQEAGASNVLPVNQSNFSPSATGSSSAQR